MIEQAANVCMNVTFQRIYDEFAVVICMLKRKSAITVLVSMRAQAACEERASSCESRRGARAGTLASIVRARALALLAAKAHARRII